VNQLAATPYSFRKAGKSSTRQELIIPFGSTGYVALYEIAGRSDVLVLALRHQREEDYHRVERAPVGIASRMAGGSHEAHAIETETP